MRNRKDGRKVKNLDAIHSLMPHLKPMRCDSDVYINMQIDMTEISKYLENLRKTKKYEQITFFHLFCTALGKTVYNRPLLNRFVINKQYYDRNDITLAFVAKRELTDEAEESFTVIKIKEDDNIFTISDQIIGNVKTLRTNNEHDVDKLMNVIGKLPKWLKGLLFGIIKFADNHDMLPESLTKDLLYYSTILVSNLGSIGCGAIYHNLTDFGTNSILVTIGEIKDEVVIVNGKQIVRKMCEFGVTLDERIADGFYFAKSLQLFEYIVQNPELLEDNANTIINLPPRKK